MCSRQVESTSESGQLKMARRVTSYARFFNEVSLRRQPSAIREITNMLPTLPKECIVLAGGMPNGSAFPLLSARFRLRDGSVIDFDETDMRIGLQYSGTDGYPPLLKKMTEFINRYHQPTVQFRQLMTPGSQDGLSKLMEAMLQPGDVIVIEEHVYTGLLSAAEPHCPEFLLVEADASGMLPEALKKALSKWNAKDCSNATCGVPKVLYICPSSGNPTGTSLPEDRKQAIYRIAQEYNLLIIEDDPYYFLQFAEKLPKSFLSMDTDGRVVRLDSFSKILAAGMRLGCVTGPPEIVERIALHMQVSVMHVPTILQQILLKMLEKWGWDGFDEHIAQVKDLYKNRRDLALAACQKHLQGLAEWYEPSGGMFLWLKAKGIKDTQELVMVHGKSEGVLCVPGGLFQPASSRKPTPYIRVSFSLASPEHIDEGMRRLANVIKKHQNQA